MSKKTSRILLRLFGTLTGVFVLYLGFIFGTGIANDWQPEERIPIQIDAKANEQVVKDSITSFLIWNVGYGSLGAQSDFFYDDEGMLYSGNSMVYSDYELCRSYVDGAKQFLANTPADFVLIQEMDSLSDRSHQIKQFDEYSGIMPNYAHTFASNYKVKRVPIPLLQPWKAYGKVESGLATWSKYNPIEATRYQLPGNYPLPNRIFQLDRCVAVHRFKTNTAAELVVMNIHNSAYDPGDEIKKLQMPYLLKLATNEYAKGNYVVLGGDWNQCPPFFQADRFKPGGAEGELESNIPADFFPEGWTFGFDATTPTNRKCKDKYVPGQTFTTLIDYYVVSPNIQIKKVKTHDLQFKYSDHQPVYMEVLLKAN